jgi:hypothetical protein
VRGVAAVLAALVAAAPLAARVVVGIVAVLAVVVVVAAAVVAVVVVVALTSQELHRCVDAAMINMTNKYFAMEQIVAIAERRKKTGDKHKYW